jgi:hypothetical protein
MHEPRIRSSPRIAMVSRRYMEMQFVANLVAYEVVYNGGLLYAASIILV